MHYIDYYKILQFIFENLLNIDHFNNLDVNYTALVNLSLPL